MCYSLTNVCYSLYNVCYSSLLLKGISQLLLQSDDVPSYWSCILNEITEKEQLESIPIEAACIVTGATKLVSVANIERPLKTDVVNIFSHWYTQ